MTHPTENELRRALRSAERAEERTFLRYQAIGAGEQDGDPAEARASWIAALLAETEADDALVRRQLGW